MVKKKELPWEEKIEKIKEALKTSFWGDFLFGGLVVSGLFIFIESLELPSFVNSIIGISLFIFAIILLFSRLMYFRIKTYRIEKIIKKAENYISERKIEKSLELLNRLLEDKRNLKIKEIWNNKAAALYILARYEDALESINYALEIDPFYKSALPGKGLLLYYLARYEEALKSFDRTVAIIPTHEGAWNNRGVTLHDLERYDEALESYDKSLAIDQNYDEAWYNKARTESIQNNKEKAIESLQEAINLNKSFKEKAKVAKDFDNIRDSQEFKVLINN